MKPLGFTLLMVALAVAVVFGLPANAQSGDDPTTRESTYPQPITNITHEPWEPVRGQDITVTVTLDPEAENPQDMRLIWCRVEPDYVCAAFPERLHPQDDGRWTGTIPGGTGDEQDVVRHDTRHIGYNISFRAEESSWTYAPTHNTWTPETFPEETGGVYYFLELGEPTEQAPAAWIPLVLLTFLAVLLAARTLRDRSPGGGPHG